MRKSSNPTTAADSPPKGDIPAWQPELDECLDSFRSRYPRGIDELRKLCQSSGEAGTRHLVESGFGEILAVLRVLIAAESSRVNDQLQNVATGSSWATTRRDALAEVNNAGLQRLFREFLEVSRCYAATVHTLGLRPAETKPAPPASDPETLNVPTYPRAATYEGPAIEIHTAALRRRSTSPGQRPAATVPVTLAGATG